jgi:hypothetical protein
VTCVKKDEDPNRLIAGIGGRGFYHPIDQAIEHIKNRTDQYFMEVAGRSVWLEVGHHADGTAFLKCDEEGFPPLSLLGLEEIPLIEEPSTSSVQDDLARLVRPIDDKQQTSAFMAERLALRMVVQMLVEKRFSDDERRRKRTRHQIEDLVAGVIERMELRDQAEAELHQALSAEFDYYFGPTSNQ